MSTSARDRHSCSPASTTPAGSPSNIEVAEETLRILLVTNLYPPHHYGGYELSCKDVVERWRGSGHQVEVLTSRTQVAGEAHISADRQQGIRRELDLYLQDQRLITPSWRRRIGIERANVRSLVRAVEDTQPDVVSVWHMSALSFGLLDVLSGVGIPIVLVVCDDWLIDGPRYDQWLRPFLGKPRLARVAHRITGLNTSLPTLPRTVTACYNSRWIQDRAERLSPFSIPRSTVVYSGIDRSDFPGPDRPRPEWGWRLLHVGRPDHRKGIHVAIDALRHLPGQATLEIIGRGNDRYARSLHERAASLGLADRIGFGYAPRSELRHRYAEADAVLFPVIWDEPFGLVPLEAMASGVPVVATGTGGSGEYLIDEVNCLLCPKKDDRALATAVERLASDGALRSRLIDGGIKTAGMLTVDRLADALEAWHLAATDGHVAGDPPHCPTPVDQLVAAGLIQGSDADR